jgi:agmatinase
MTDYHFAYLTSTNSPGFLRAPPLADRPDADTVVAGIAWDGATTNRPGSRFGPFAIRRASHMLCDGEIDGAGHDAARGNARPQLGRHGLV